MYSLFHFKDYLMLTQYAPLWNIWRSCFYSAPFIEDLIQKISPPGSSTPKNQSIIISSKNNFVSKPIDFTHISWSPYNCMSPKGWETRRKAGRSSKCLLRSSTLCTSLYSVYSIVQNLKPVFKRLALSTVHPTWLSFKTLSSISAFQRILNLVDSGTGPRTLSHKLSGQISASEAKIKTV